MPAPRYLTVEKDDDRHGAAFSALHSVFLNSLEAQQPVYLKRIGKQQAPPYAVVCPAQIPPCPQARREANPDAWIRSGWSSGKRPPAVRFRRADPAWPWPVRFVRRSGSPVGLGIQACGVQDQG